MSFNWKSLVSTVAPVIGTALGGPFGALASTVLCSVLGIDTNSEEAVVAQAMKNATPEQLMALQNAERQFKLDMEKLGVDLAKIDADDRNSARLKESTLTGWGKYATPLLGSVVIAGFFGTVGYVLADGLTGLDSQAAMLVGSLIGYVSAKADQVVGYYFGSSAGSKNKDQLLFNSTSTGTK
jgi:hypothetical protein